MTECERCYRLMYEDDPEAGSEAGRPICGDCLEEIEDEARHEYRARPWLGRKLLGMPVEDWLQGLVLFGVVWLLMVVWCAVGNAM